MKERYIYKNVECYKGKIEKKGINTKLWIKEREERRDKYKNVESYKGKCEMNRYEYKNLETVKGKSVKEVLK